MKRTKSGRIASGRVIKERDFKLLSKLCKEYKVCSTEIIFTKPIPVTYTGAKGVFYCHSLFYVIECDRKTLLKGTWKSKDLGINEPGELIMGTLLTDEYNRLISLVEDVVSTRIKNRLNFENGKELNF